MLNIEFLSPAISRNYSIKEFKRDLKLLMGIAGTEARRVVFYIEDHHLIES